TFSAPSTASNMFGTSTTTTASPFAAPATSTPSFTFGTSTAPTTS
ncbi:unnamed protein product, partial [Rotaria socialis]